MAGFRETAAGAAVACAVLLAAPVAASGAFEEEPICVGDSCQPLPSEPEDPTPATLVPNEGNPPLHVFQPKKKHFKGLPGKRRHSKHKHRHKHKHGGRGRFAR